MKKLIIVLLLFGFAEGNSQIQGKDNQANVNDVQDGAMFRSFDNRFKGIEGYPTLVKAYCPGQIVTIAGKKIKYDSINLDVYSHDLLVKRENAESVFNKRLVKEFLIESEETTMIFVKLKSLEGSDSFYQVLAGTTVKLLKYTFKTIAGPTNTGAYSSGRMNSVFEEKSKMYVQKGTDQLFELKNKKTLLSQFHDQEEEISKFMKSHQISLKDENEAGKLIEFLNTLL